MSFKVLENADKDDMHSFHEPLGGQKAGGLPRTNPTVGFYTGDRNSWSLNSVDVDKPNARNRPIDQTDRTYLSERL